MDAQLLQIIQAVDRLYQVGWGAFIFLAFVWAQMFLVFLAAAGIFIRLGKLLEKMEDL